MRYLISCNIILAFLLNLNGQSVGNSTKLTYQQYRDSVEVLYVGRDNLGTNSLGLPKYKHWARNSYWTSSHLDDQGKPVNISRRNLKLWRQNMDQARQASFANWNFIGPSNTTGTSKGLGRIDRIAFHPTNASIFYVGSPAGGLWRTSNGGVSWTPLTDELPSLGVSGIVVDQDNPRQLFILTGTGDGNGFSSIYNYRQSSVGVMKSTDGGASWSFTGSFPNSGETYFGYKLEQSPLNSNYLLATTNVGLYRSLNKGVSWEKVFGGQCYDIEFSHTTNKAFVTTGPFNSSCVFSEDNFDTWDPITFSGAAPTNAGRWEMASTPGEPCRFYLFCGKGNGSIDSFNGFYESINCGDTFVSRANSPNILGSPQLADADGQSQYDMAIAANPVAGQGHIVITGGLVLFRSMSHGLSFQKNTDYFEQASDPSSYIHPDVHDLAYNPLNGNVYAATDGGLFLSNNNGNTWSNLSSGLETSMIYNLAGTHLSDHKLLSGHQDNGIQYRSGNTSTYQFLQTGDGFSVQFSPTNSGNGFCSVNANLYKWTNSFTNVATITPSEQNLENHFFPRILAHNTDPNRLICSYAITYYSTNGGSSWTKPELNVNGRGYHALVSCPSNNNRVYAAGAPGFNDDFSIIYRSDNFGETWTGLGLNPGYPDADARVTGIAVDPNQSANVWVAMGQFIENQKVFYSTNAGNSWTNMSADLPNLVVNCIAVDEYNGVYIGTDQGVYYRNIFSIGWTPFSNKLPNTPVASLVVNNDLNLIRAGTYGRGVWESPIYSACVNHLTIGNQEGDFFYQTNASISVIGEMQGGIGTSGHLRSGQLIFLPGFSTAKNQKMLFEIGPCGFGGLP